MLNAKSIVLLSLLPLTLVACEGDYDESISFPEDALSDTSSFETDDDVVFDTSPSTPDHPFGRSPIMTEDFDKFGVCYSEAQSDQADFFNSGTPCIDGMVALISGRGCPEVVYEDNEDGTHSIYCTTEPTCDVVHSDGYLAIPNSLDWSDFGNRSQMMCQDNNVTLVYFSNKSSVIDQ